MPAGIDARTVRANCPSYEPPISPQCREHPGIELHKFLARFGQKEELDCQCKSRMIEMDRRGCQWCRENIDTIIGWLREEAERRGFPFDAEIEAFTQLLIERAIKRAEKQSLATD